MELPYSVQVVPDVCTDGTQCYLASHPELPGCMSHGDTIEEAVHNLNEARRLYIRSLLKRNLAVPLPQGMPGSSNLAEPRIDQRVEWLVVSASSRAPRKSPLLVEHKARVIPHHSVAAVVS